MLELGSHSATTVFDMSPSLCLGPRSRDTGAQVTTGGTTLKDDIMRLYNVVHILVGTPGRVLDLADKGIANLKECTTLIMDEVRSYPPSPSESRNTPWAYERVVYYFRSRG